MPLADHDHGRVVFPQAQSDILMVQTDTLPDIQRQKDKTVAQVDDWWHLGRSVSH
jgi:hypothetical protein